MALTEHRSARHVDEIAGYAVHHAVRARVSIDRARPLQANTGSANFWLAVLTDLRKRGVEDVVFLVCDGLKGLPASVEHVWPETIVQTCFVHLFAEHFQIRAWQHWDRLKPIYQAVNAAPAEAAIDQLEEYRATAARH